jgi:hypothetical protein
MLCFTENLHTTFLAGSKFSMADLEALLLR